MHGMQLRSLPKKYDPNLAISSQVFVNGMRRCSPPPSQEVITQSYRKKPELLYLNDVKLPFHNRRGF